MNTKKSIKKNFIMNAILTLSSFVFPLITFSYTSRVLLDDGTGKVSFATSIISYFVMFSQLGIPVYGVRICSKCRDDKIKLSKTVHELLFINFVMTVLSYILFAITLFIIPKIAQEKILYLIISATIFLSCIGIEWLYKALEEYTYITIRSIVFKFIALVAMLLLVHKHEDYVIYGGVSILASSASYICNFFNAHKYIHFSYLGEYDYKKHLKPILIFFAMACATTVYTNLDVVMLGFMCTDSDVGYYHAAVRIKGILVSIVTSLGAVLLPRSSYYLSNGQTEKFRTLTSKALNFVFLAATPLTVYFMVFARHGILFLSGETFEGAIIPMQIIMPTLLLIGITNILGIQILVPTGREKNVLYSEIIGAVIDVALNAVLIPVWRASGAAIGTLVAEFAVLVYQYKVLRNEVNESFRIIHMKKILLAVIASSCVSFWVIFLNLGNFISLVISSVLFFGTYLLVMLISKEEFVVENINQVMATAKRKIGIVRKGNKS